MVFQLYSIAPESLTAQQLQDILYVNDLTAKKLDKPSLYTQVIEFLTAKGCKHLEKPVAPGSFVLVKTKLFIIPYQLGSGKNLQTK